MNLFVPAHATSTMLTLDASMGAAGDMLVSALVDLGGNRSRLEVVEEVVPVDLEFGRVDRSGQSSLHLDVDTGGNVAHRSYREVVELVENLGLDRAIVDDAREVFRLIGEAEASIHGVDLEDLNFHEVGADDAVADVLAACILFDDMDEDVYVGNIRVGGGTVDAAHGKMSVPVPAVSEIMKNTGHVIEGGPVDEELLTPTGAALLAHFAEPVDSLPAGKVEAVGYGAGTRDFEGYSNVLRATLSDGGMDRDEVVMLETNVDDVSGEVIGGLYGRLDEEGARDVSVVPLYMKKNRPGYLIKVIARRSDAQGIAETLARETGTLGVRESPVEHRFVADRRYETVELSFGSDSYEVTVKLGEIDGEVFDVSAEYEDAAEVAEKTGLTVRMVVEAAEANYEQNRE
ncbi:MAG: nickel pincer cofactor biosynthesis protein LarC [Halobacteria archaeon]